MHLIWAFIIILIVVFIPSNASNAQPLQSFYNQTLYGLVRQNSGVHDACQIALGSSPIVITASDRFLGGVFDSEVRMAYTANLDSDTVSVISTENNTKIKDIPVGDGPIALDVNRRTGTVYVANSFSRGVSVIDEIFNRVAAEITFHVNPFKSGYFLCDELTSPAPIGQYAYVYSGAQCTAKPNEGFQFSSWEENNLKDNSI